MSEKQQQIENSVQAQVGALPATDFPTIYRLLAKLNYSQQEDILNLEQQLYSLIKQSPDVISGLIILMQEQIMRGEQQKAKALAYKIWDMGGEMSPSLEALFISNLINVGLTDMAGILLKPKFDSLNTYVKIFYPQLSKYAIVTGNINYMEKLAALDSDFDRKKALKELVDVFKCLGATEHFRALQQSLINMIKDVTLSIEYNLYTDRGFTDLEMVIYVGYEAGDLQALADKLEMQITAYCTAKSLPRFNNLCYRVNAISVHPSLAELQAQG